LIAEELRDVILSGKVALGQRLSEEKLAASLKFSRVPLHSALRRLEGEGYVTFMSHGEIAINKPSLGEVESYYSIAGALEGLAAVWPSNGAMPKTFPGSENCIEP
jgi:GntR family transcriptional regulator of vanillate catabolism